MIRKYSRNWNMTRFKFSENLLVDILDQRYEFSQDSVNVSVTGTDFRESSRNSVFGFVARDK